MDKKYYFSKLLDSWAKEEVELRKYKTAWYELRKHLDLVKNPIAKIILKKMNELLEGLNG